MKKLVLTNRARDELREIYVYTLDTFGLAQAECYHEQLGRPSICSGSFPSSGGRRDKLRPGLRLYAAGRHQILYSVSEAIEIEGLPHDSRDLDAYIEGSEGG